MNSSSDFYLAETSWSKTDNVRTEFRYLLLSAGNEP